MHFVDDARDLGRVRRERGAFVCEHHFFNVQHPPTIGLAQCTFIGPLIFSSDQIANQALRIFSTTEGTVECEGRFSLAAPPVHLEGDFLPVCALLFRRGSWAHLHARTARAFCFSRSACLASTWRSHWRRKKFWTKKTLWAAAREYGVWCCALALWDEGWATVEKIWAVSATVVERDETKKSSFGFLRVISYNADALGRSMAQPLQRSSVFHIKSSYEINFLSVKLQRRIVLYIFS